jgi:hypothetical protein
MFAQAPARSPLAPQWTEADAADGCAWHPGGKVSIFTEGFEPEQGR